MAKNVSLVVSSLVLLSLGLALAGGTQKPSRPCDDALTTVEMLECSKQRYETADRQLNQVYKELKLKLSKSRQTKLKLAQRAWITFRDATAEFEASEVTGGSMYPLVYLVMQAEMTENRVGELRQILMRLGF